MIDSNLVTAVSTLLGVLAVNGLAYWRLRYEIHQKTDAQTDVLNNTARGVAKVVATKLEQTESIHRSELKATNNFNIRIARLEGRQEVLQQYLELILKATGIETHDIPKEGC